MKFLTVQEVIDQLEDIKTREGADTPVFVQRSYPGDMDNIPVNDRLPAQLAHRQIITEVSEGSSPHSTEGGYNIVVEIRTEGEVPSMYPEDYKRPQITS